METETHKIKLTLGGPGQMSIPSKRPRPPTLYGRFSRFFRSVLTASG